MKRFGMQKSASGLVVAAVLGVAALGAAGTAAFVGTSVLVAEPAAAWPRKVVIYCKSDYKRFCPRYKVGSAQMRACMRSNASNLSPICKKTLIETGIARAHGF